MLAINVVLVLQVPHLLHCRLSALDQHLDITRNVCSTLQDNLEYI